VHFVGIWNRDLAFGIGIWDRHLAPVTGAGTGTGAGAGTRAGSRIMKRGGTETPFISEFIFRQYNGHSQKLFSFQNLFGEFVYQLRGSLRHGPRELRRRVAGGRQASAGTQSAGDSVSPIRARRLGPDEDRARKHDTSGRSAILAHGGSESTLNSMLGSLSRAPPAPTGK
jgi:hypothetical protein